MQGRFEMLGKQLDSNFESGVTSEDSNKQVYPLHQYQSPYFMNAQETNNRFKDLEVLFHKAYFD